MKVVEKLLEGTPQQNISDFESKMQFHLKQILTTINKHTLEDMTQIRKYQCIRSCYNYHTQSNKNTKEDSSALWQRVQELRTCKEQCLGETKEVEKFLDNINFYSKKKYQGCSSGCEKAKTQSEHNICLWQCLNRLDRRYKQYWAGQKLNIEARFKI